MTEPSPLTWDELDQLADYTAGTLTPQHTQHIAHLIATDPRWTTAHHTLQQTQPTLTTALTTAAHHTPPIPPELTAKLAAITDSSVMAGGRPGPARPPRRPATGRPSSDRPPASRPVRRRPVLVGLLAAVLFGSLGGLAIIRGALFSVAGDNSAPALAENGGDGYAPEPPASAPSGRPSPAITTFGNGPGLVPEGEPGPVTMLASDFDYAAASLRNLAADAATRAVTFGDPQLQAGSLARLNTADGYRACAAAVLSRHPGRISRVEYARYDGVPALILIIANSQMNKIIAVSAECGVDGSAHELASVEAA